MNRLANRDSMLTTPVDGERPPIAIIGIGCRFPGNANDPVAFWNLLENGVDAITEIPANRWNKKRYYDSDMSKPGKLHTLSGGFIENLDQFDPHFFGISRREAARIDPQQRMLLEVAWEALEDGGQVLERLAGSNTSVFVGISSWDYSFKGMSFVDRGTPDVHSNTGGSLSIAANRISYSFDFRGPSAAIDTACSSGLVAVHLACQSIWHQNCNLALAGGVSALLLPDWYIGFSRLGMLAPDGRCKAFDARANGFVRSEGAGIVALKPLAQALADGDRIYAVIRGTAVNQDGRTQGMTVPSQAAQEALLLQACHDARVSPSQIQYVEAHGTGTQVGDPIEARALGRVLGPGRRDGERCFVGSVKTNIGHLEAGAGAASVIKVALSVYHQQIPRNLHFLEPNPNIDFKQLRLRVPERNEPWPKQNGSALAGINSFGYGGTNAHLIVGEATQVTNENKNDSTFDGPVLLPLSARSADALKAAAKSMADFVFQTNDDVSLSEIAGNAVFRRTHHEHRLAAVADTKEQLVERLRLFADGESVAEIITGRAVERKSPRLAFVCSGQGPQWWAMGRQLLEREPLFRDVIERCDAVVRELGDWSLLDELLADEDKSRMSVTAISQPCIYALQVGLAAILESWGVRPSALLGHSVGEVAAAHLAGVFTLEEGMRVIYHRGRCMELASPMGGMLAASLTADDAQALVAGRKNATIAAINSPASVTFSGEEKPLKEIAVILEERGVFCKFLQVNYAFHSSQMDPIRDELLQSLADIRPRRATRALFSTVTGKRVEGPELDAEYWWHNVRQAVRFVDGMNQIIDANCDTIVELSPHPVLSGSVSECFDGRGKSVTVLPTLRRKAEEKQSLLRTAGALHAMGCRLKWTGIQSKPRTFVRLPSYPWQHERCWFESDESRITRTTPPSHPLLGCSDGGPLPVWQNRMDLQLFPYMADHRVQGAALLPATAFLELAFAVACEVSESPPWKIENFRLANACFLPADDSLWMQTSCRPDDGSLKIHSRIINSEKPWTAHVSANVGSASGISASPKKLDLENLQKRCSTEFSREEFYQYLNSLGLDYGPQFQVLANGSRGDGEALGFLELPDSLSIEDFHLHPILFDACFQLVGAADPDFPNSTGVYLPVSVRKAQLFHSPGRRAWCHARMVEKKPEAFIADLDIYDDNGSLAASVKELRCQRMAGGKSEESLASLQYAFHWQTSAQASEVDAEPHRNGTAKHPGHWLLFADKIGVADRLAQRLQKRGEQYSIVTCGPSYSEIRGDRYRINPNSGDDMKRLLETVLEKRNECRGIVHLWSLDAETDNNLMETVETGVFSALHLVQAWEEIAPDAESHLFVVTNGAQSVGEQPQSTALVQSPMLGLGRVIVNECPKLHCRLLDLPGDFDECDEQSLFDELWLQDDEDEVALRDKQRYIQRFLPFTEEPPIAETTTANGPFRLATANPGTLDALRYQSLERKPPGPNEVEIEVKAAGLNFADVLKALGLYPNVPDGPIPFGGECSGVITRVGEGVTNVAVGDEVIAVASFSFGSHVPAKAVLTALKPRHLTFEEAATIPVAYMTAYYALNHLGRMQPGESVLIHSASGGVGQAALQLAQDAGAEVFATAGTPEKRDFLKQQGVSLVMDSRSLDFADQIMEHTRAKGVDLILNSLTGEAIARGMEILADYGRFLEIGKRDIYDNTRLGLRPFRNNLSFFAIDLDRTMRERPELLGGIVRRIADMASDRRVKPLPMKVFPIRETDAAFRLMQQGKHIGKIVLSFDKSPVTIHPNTDQPISFPADASFLITGGLGGFGLATARWMVERGAQHLALMGRRGIHSEQSKQAVADLEKMGAVVSVIQGDIANAKDVQRAFADIDQTMPPLRGVIHAAMVLDDGMLLNMDHDWMRRVMAPKIQGAWNLHQQSIGRPLDWFILFSSLSSVFGHAGQGNYAAGNAFLDALAYHRRANDLPALTINWGYLKDVGYISEREELAQRLERQGVHGFTIDQALACLEDAMRRQLVQTSVLKIDWSRWRGLGTSGRVSPRFAHLLRESATEKHIQNGVANSHISSIASLEERQQWLRQVLWEKVAHVLGTTPDKLDGETSLLHLGLDSLMAVELRNWIESELRIHVPIVELMRSPCLSRLADLLCSQHATKNGTPETQNGDTVRHDAKKAETFASVERMSDEQVDSLLAEMLEKNSG